MNSVLFYKAMSGFYYLLDVIYFRKYDTSPRKVVNEAIKDYDKMILSIMVDKFNSYQADGYATIAKAA